MFFLLLFILVVVVGAYVFMESRKLFSNRGPAAKHRRRGNAQSRAQRDSIIPINIANMTRKNHFPIQVFKSDTNYYNYDVFNADDGMNRASLSKLPIDLSDSNSRNPSNIDLSRFSGRRDRRVSIKRLTNIEKPTETGNAWIKPPNHKEDDEITPSIQHSAVTVQRVSKSANLNATNNQSKTMDQRFSSTLTSKTSRVSVTKIPRKKSDMNQLERSSNISHENVTDLEKSSIEMKPIRNQLNGALSAGYPKKNDATSGVTVVKLPRNSSIN
jgi:flagellar hook-basal body complex protein FliE